MFGQDFLALNPAWNHFMIDVPFFRLDKSVPFNLPPQDAALADDFFRKIFEEYHSDHADKFQFIQAYTGLLLHLTKRYFGKLSALNDNTHNKRTADILLVSRFQTMIETELAASKLAGEARSPSFYAVKLYIHPNHLNAVVKRITGKTATTLIQNKLIAVAKTLLGQAHLSVKEIAFRLHFKKPTLVFTSYEKLRNQRSEK